MTILSRRTFLTTMATAVLAQLTWQHRLTPLAPYFHRASPRTDAASPNARTTRVGGLYPCPKHGGEEAPRVFDPRYSELLQDFPKASNYVDYVETHVRETGLDPLLVMAVIRLDISWSPTLERLVSCRSFFLQPDIWA